MYTTETCKILGVNFFLAKKMKRFASITTDSPNFKTAMIWDYDDKAITVSVGDVWSFVGELKEYKDDVNLHIDAEQSTIIEASTLKNHWNFLEQGQINYLYDKTIQYAKSLQNTFLQHMICTIMNHLGEHKIKNAPGSVSHHHCYRGGYLDHVIDMLDAADALFKTPTYADKGMSRDVVIAGILLHDIGKIYTYSTEQNGAPPKRTFMDLSFGHINLSCDVLITALANFTEKERSKLNTQEYEELCNIVRHIKHVILSHHGTREWGSPVAPCTLEANFVHLIDMMSSKMGIALLTAFGSATHPNSKFEDFGAIAGYEGPNEALQLSKESRYYTHERFKLLTEG